MHTNDTQQEHSYHEFIQNFSSLFKKIQSDKMEKEDDPIFDAMAGFNTVKFLIEHVDWDEDKDKACEFILQECDKTKETKQKLESEVKERLKKYIDGGVEKVSIYGNHASITLEDNKKEFEISEFLNSDFCQKNGISGFSTSHSDGKSGMHGFVAEEGGRKIRHYVVTDGSYEMTLNWYDTNGEKCTIKINIDDKGVEFIERNGVTDAQLQANKDVKIGNLYLHEALAQGKWKENEVEHEKKGHDRSFETTTRIDVNRNVGVQATDVTRGVESKHATTSTTNSNNASAKKIPPPVKTSSLPPKQENPTHEVQQKGKHQPTTVSNGNDYGFPSSDPSAFTQSLGPDQNDKQRDERYDNPTFTTFRSEKRGDLQSHSGPQSDSKGDLGVKSMTSSTLSDNNGKPLSPISTEGNVDVEQSSDTTLQKSPYKSGQEPEGEELNYQNTREALERWKEKRLDNYKRINEDVKETSFNTPKEIQSELQKDNLADVKTASASTVSVSTTSSKSRNDSGFSSPTHTNHYNSQVNPEQLKASLMNVEQSDDTLLTEFTSKLDKETQKFPLRSVDQKEMSAQTRERLLEDGLLKDNSTGVETVADPTVSVSTTSSKSRNDSGFSSPTYDNHEKSKVDPKHLIQKLEAYKVTIRPVDKKLKSTQSTHPAESELEKVLKELDKRLKEPARQVTEENIPKDLFSENVLEKMKEEKPIYKWLKDKIEGKENNQNLNALEENLSQKSGQGDVVGKRENDSSRPLSSVSTHASEQPLSSPTLNGRNDSGFASPTHTDHHESQKQLKASLMNVKQSDDTLLTEFTSKLNKETQKFPLKPVDQKEISEQTRELLLEAGLLKGSSTGVETVWTKRIAKPQEKDTKGISR